MKKLAFSIVVLALILFPTKQVHARSFVSGLLDAASDFFGAVARFNSQDISNAAGRLSNEARQVRTNAECNLRVSTDPGTYCFLSPIDEAYTGVSFANDGALADYLRRFFQLSVSFAGVVLFFSLVYAGLQYITAGVNIGKKANATDHFWKALEGFALILMSYVILNTINPALTDFNFRVPPIPVKKSAATLRREFEQQLAQENASFDQNDGEPVITANSIHNDALGFLQGSNSSTVNNSDFQSTLDALTFYNANDIDSSSGFDSFAFDSFGGSDLSTADVLNVDGTGAGKNAGLAGSTNGLGLIGSRLKQGDVSGNFNSNADTALNNLETTPTYPGSSVDSFFASKNTAKIGDKVTPQLTAYSPRGTKDALAKVEGGYESSKPDPDGNFVVHTMDDVDDGTSSFVTLAGDPKEYGKIFVIPSITYVNKQGETVTKKDVIGIVHDTGCAFMKTPRKGCESEPDHEAAGTSHYDVAIGRDYPSSITDRLEPFTAKGSTPLQQLILKK